MGSITNIEWTDVTDNIIVVEGGGWWCRKISDGCKNCYAAKLNQSSFFGGNKLAYSGQMPKLELRRDIIWGWGRQTKPKRHFVASMTDVFGEWVEREWIFEFLDGMDAAPLQTFQVLTKRPAVAAREIAAWLEAHGEVELPPNIWIGTSVENQEAADERIPHLLSIPAKVRFLSCEPLLSAVDLGLRSSTWKGIAQEWQSRWIRLTQMVRSDFMGLIPGSEKCIAPAGVYRASANHCGALCIPTPGGDLGVKPGEFECLGGIDWVIVGGESGPGARPMHPDWARSLRDQCAGASVPFLFKQWGEYREPLQGDPFNIITPWLDGPHVIRVGKKAAGRLLDGVEHNGFPQVESEVAA